MPQIKALLSDFSWVLLTPIDSIYRGSLNTLYKELRKADRFDFWSHFRFNEELGAFYKNLKQKISIYLFTTESIQDDPALSTIRRELFKDVFSSFRLGLPKGQPSSYNEIAKRIGFLPSEILFIDDMEKNVIAARQAGLIVVRYKDNAQTIKDVERILEK